jgi:glycosyltransferase involved in cell wall biosynthesis
MSKPTKMPTTLPPAPQIAVPEGTAQRSAPMKVLHVLHTPRAEGTVRLTLDWLSEPVIQQEVFVLNPEPAEMTAELQARASWYTEGTGFPKGRLKFPWMVLETRRICLLRMPDLVICWMNGFSPWILTGARLAGVPQLITHAGNPPCWNFWGKASTVFSTFVAWATGGRMVCCSRYVASEFARSPMAFKSVLRSVPNCAQVERIRADADKARAGRRNDPQQLVMVATLEAHKDHATLLRAMPIVIGALPQARLWLAGDGSLRASLEALSNSLGLGRSVTFLGSRGDVPALLGQSDVFVFSTTQEEGLGTVLIEAMAAGLPIVASDVPACREVLSDGHWGTLVPPADPGALAATLIACLQRKEVADSGERREHLKVFSPKYMIASYLSAIH